MTRIQTEATGVEWIGTDRREVRVRTSGERCRRSSWLGGEEGERPRGGETGKGGLGSGK